MIGADDLAKLKQYRAHKIVHADKVTAVLPGRGEALMRWQLASGVVVDVNEQLAARPPRNSTVIGGYFVRYPDGFESWSPADAFQGGYEEIRNV